LDKNVLEKTIYECVSIKAGIVEKDEFDDKDLRIILNFGHTLGHAIEASTGYSKEYNHGESISIGMVLAGEISKRLKMFSDDNLKRIETLLRTAGLPTKVKKIPFKKIMESYAHDKKFTKGTNRFVLPRKIGSVTVVENISEKLIKTALKCHAE